MTISCRLTLSPLLLASILFLAACSPDDNSESANSASLKHLQRAQTYIDQGQYKAAMIEAKNARQQRPEDDAGVIMTAKIYNSIGQPRQAIALLEALDASTSADYTITLAQAYIKRGKYQSALDTLSTITEPTEKDTLALLAATGNAHTGLGQFEQAEATYQEALSRQPSNQPALLGLAQLRLSQRDIEAAKTLIGQLLEVNPEHAQALYLQANITADSGDYEQAEEQLTELIGLLSSTDVITPIRANTLQRLIDILTRQGRSNEAYIYTQVLQEAMPGATELKAKFSAAIEAFKNKDLETAEAQLNEVLALAPSHELAGTLLGTIKYLKGDLSGAEHYFSEYVDAETASTQALRASAITSLKMQNPEKVLALLGDSIDKTQSPELLSIFGLAAISSGQIPQGIAALERAAIISPDNARLHLIIAKGLNAQQPADSDGALQALRLGYKKAPQDQTIQLALLAQYQQMDNAAEAQQLLANILENTDDAIASHLLASRYYLTVGNKASSQQHMNKALQLDPTNIDTLSLAARVELASKNYSQAQHWLEKVIAVNPELSGAYKMLISSYEQQVDAEQGVARVKQLAKDQPKAQTPVAVITEYYLRRGDHANGQLYLDKLQALAPDSTAFTQLSIANHAGQARQAVAAKNYSDARSSLLAALQIKADNLPILAMLVQVEIADKQYNEASKISDKIAELNPSGIQSQLFQAIIAEHREQPSVAENIYVSLWQQKPESVVASRYHSLLLKNNRTEEATAFLKQWAQALATDTQPLILQAMQHYQQQQIPEAIALYEQALALAPKSFAILNNLAFAYDTINDPKALATAKKAYDLAPANQAAVLDTYGWLLVKDGQSSLGIELLEKASQLAPNNQEIAGHLTVALAK